MIPSQRIQRGTALPYNNQKGKGLEGKKNLVLPTRYWFVGGVTEWGEGGEGRKEEESTLGQKKEKKIRRELQWTREATAFLGWDGKQKFKRGTISSSPKKREELKDGVGPIDRKVPLIWKGTGLNLYFERRV